MSIQNEINEVKEKLKKLEEKEKNQKKQEEVNRINTFKIACSCGAEQSVDEYWETRHKDRSIRLGMSWYDSSISVECRVCGKKFHRRNWENG